MSPLVTMIGEERKDQSQYTCEHQETQLRVFFVSIPGLVSVPW
jgi:hypothetical protein